MNYLILWLLIISKSVSRKYENAIWRVMYNMENVWYGMYDMEKFVFF